MTLIDIIALIAVFAAYVIKGLSGFGPALILIPLLTMFYDPSSAIMASTLFDVPAGIILFLSVYKRVDWKFVIPMLLLFFPSAYLGAYLMKVTPSHTLERFIGAGILAFSVMLFTQKSAGHSGGQNRPSIYPLGAVVALLSGFLGGLIGISGPLLVLYMKFRYAKTYFRDQLIAIFMFGAIWRLSLYMYHQVPMQINTGFLLVMLFFVANGLWVGHRLHLRLDEVLFNRIVAAILLIPAVNLLFF